MGCGNTATRRVRLPRLLTFDMVFIDGYHTFDHALVDPVYANRLMLVGGYIVIDDCNWSSAANAVGSVAMYPAYEVKNQPWPKGTRKQKSATAAVQASGEPDVAPRPPPLTHI